MSRPLILNGQRMPRRFRSHLGILGTRFREHYLALEETYGPFVTALQKEAAADCAQAHCLKLVATRTWEEAQVARENGKGRRPNARLVVQLSKRVALDTGSYTLLVNRLRELCPRAEGHRDLRHLLTPSRSATR